MKKVGGCSSNDRNMKKLERAKKRLEEIQGLSIPFKRAQILVPTESQVIDNKTISNIKPSVYGNCPNVSLRYKKLNRIGQGTYGIVYAAEDLQANVSPPPAFDINGIESLTYDKARARNSDNDDLNKTTTVALKRCLPHHESTDGFPITTLREIQILREISVDHTSNYQDDSSRNVKRKRPHPHIVHLHSVAVGSKPGSVFLVLQHAGRDMASIIDEHYSTILQRNSKSDARCSRKINSSFDSPFSESDAKRLSLQLLDALSFLHGKGILHRDLKLSNLLYRFDEMKGGVLTLADFGLARRIGFGKDWGLVKDSTSKKNDGGGRKEGNISENHHDPRLTSKVVSLWYRPPELLFDATDRYGRAIDNWGAGCVIAEFLLGVPLFKGKNEIDQVRLMVETLGPPHQTEDRWPGRLSDLNLAMSSGKESNGKNKEEWENVSHKMMLSLLLDKFGDCISSSSGITLLRNLLRYNPMNRLTAVEALESTWFHSRPSASDPRLMPRFSSTNIK